MFICVLVMAFIEANEDTQSISEVRCWGTRKMAFVLDFFHLKEGRRCLFISISNIVLGELLLYRPLLSTNECADQPTIYGL